MRIAIKRDGENIAVLKDFSDIADIAEVAQVICELELIKKELLIIFDRWKVENDFSAD